MNSSRLATAYVAHIAHLQQACGELLQRLGYERLVIHSGAPLGRFLDDQSLPFYANPHFKHWLPLPRHPHGFIELRPGATPRLFYHNPTDFWHLSAGSPEGFWCAAFEVIEIDDPQQARKALGRSERTAVISDHPEVARWELGELNPPQLLHGLNWLRSIKSDYERLCLREANRVAVAGHRAAANAFQAGASEFEIHQAYLQASGQRETELPYGSIVALGQHGAVLHYQQLDRQRTAEPTSLLIDAGAEVNGYCADITRTYAAHGGLFAELIAALDAVQRRLCDALQPGSSFVELHQRTHQAIALLLQAFKLVDMDPQSQVESGLTRTFFPHGLGHLLGIQVHDVAGLVSDAQGSPLPAPDQHPYLRLTRVLEPAMVLTIEPGLYFIDSLLQSLRSRPEGRAVDWALVEQLRPYGGIRIEDNLLVQPEAAENLTRDAFRAMQS